MARIALLVAFVLVACQSAPAPGAACERSSECSSPLVCRHGRCRSECREARDCPPGLRCLLDASGVGACTLGGESTCTADTECGSDLVCAGAQCRITCASDLACGTGGTCPAGSCVQPVSGADAGTPPGDAGSVGGRPSAGTGSLCVAASDGGTCSGSYVCATENEDLSMPVCRLPCSRDADCLNEGVGSFCGTRGHCTTPCDPADGTGCGTETCTLYTGNPPAPEVMSDYTDCRPPGAAAEGGACVQHVDCGAGLSCINFCRRICHWPARPGECPSGQSCHPMAPIVNGTDILFGACCDTTSGC